MAQDNTNTHTSTRACRLTTSRARQVKLTFYREGGGQEGGDKGMVQKKERKNNINTKKCLTRRTYQLKDEKGCNKEKGEKNRHRKRVASRVEAVHASQYETLKKKDEKGVACYTETKRLTVLVICKQA